MNERFEQQTMEGLIENLYSPEMPYHNFEHAKTALTNGEAILAACDKEGIVVDKEVVRAALLFHDAGYHEDHRSKGYAVKEEYSAAIAEEVLRRLGRREELVAAVKAAILSTHRDAEFSTNEAKVVRAADLAGLAGEYEDFLDANRRLKKEAETLTGSSISWSDWKKKSAEIIGFYLAQDIRLTRQYEDVDGTSRFHNRARRNLERFLAEDDAALEGKAS